MEKCIWKISLHGRYLAGQECSGGKIFLPVKKERSLFPFPWEERKNRSSGLRPEAAGAAVSDFVFLTGNARIFFVSFL